MGDENENVDQLLEEAFAKDESELTPEDKTLLEEKTKGMSENEIVLQKEKTRLGRKLKGVQERQDKLEQEMKELRAKNAPEPAPAPEEKLSPDDEAEAERQRIRDEYFDKPDVVAKKIAEIDSKTATLKEKEYQDGYYKKLSSNDPSFVSMYEKVYGEKKDIPLTEEEQLSKEIYEEMFAKDEKGAQPYNQKRTGDAAIDAEINTAYARASVMARYAAEGKKPVYRGPGDRSNPGLGDPAGTHSSQVSGHQAAPKLDDRLERYARDKSERTGRPYEEIARELA